MANNQAYSVDPTRQAPLGQALDNGTTAVDPTRQVSQAGVPAGYFRGPTGVIQPLGGTTNAPKPVVAAAPPAQTLSDSDKAALASGSFWSNILGRRQPSAPGASNSSGPVTGLLRRALVGA